MQHSILLFQDKLGITSGYEGIWQTLLTKVELLGIPIHRRSTYKALGEKVQLLIRKGNRKSPGFNEDPRTQTVVKNWASSQLNAIKPTLVICQDPALFFLLNSDWNQATPENMRGGNYTVAGIPWVVTLPLSSWHTKKSEKDVARLNEGFTDKEEWEEEQGGDESDSGMTTIWMEPMTVPYGRFVLQKDMEKVSRVLRRTIMDMNRKELLG